MVMEVIAGGPKREQRVIGSCGDYASILRSPCGKNLADAELTTSNWAKMAKCSQDTAYRDILDLIDRGALRKNEGGGRSTSYSIALPADRRAPGGARTRYNVIPVRPAQPALAASHASWTSFQVTSATVLPSSSMKFSGPRNVM